ncbi:ubiquitin conjugation factor E4 A [Nasonia vitripennis]|uniref:Ubiquitin conjugation factor E4 A n=1 Tax=Nasonia vitripennis TaxID=7425 RepID=A0A7M7H7Q6_NASVI|nr:ubiquitin conjugation factor E4 A [Nasonia vitripennis]XP_008212775.1 ubiquitin conjugation factor E4 A [Nasonia vitripennis]XP_008212776.1 ubiquitin conjugation factor E4 A [Nasonia vitripennis]
MCDKINSNPFAALLLPTINDTATFSAPAEVAVNKPINESTNIEEESIQQIHKENENVKATLNSDESSKDERLDELIADVFGITLHHEKRKKPTRQLVFIDTDSVEHAIFERLLLSEPESMLISKENTKGQDLDSHVVQSEIVPYLFESYCRLQRYRVSDGSYDTVENIRKIIMRDISTALQEPALFVDQEVHTQFVSLFMNGGIVGSELSSFIGGIVENLCSENEGSEAEVISTAFSPILDVIHKEAASSNLLLFKQYWFCILQTFASFEPLAKLIIIHSSVKSKVGKAYADTLLGALLSLSCLPKTGNGPYDFFDKPFEQQNSAVDGNIWTALDALSESMHKVFHSLLRCSREARHLTLLWLGDCLNSNASRGKLWNSHNNMGVADLTTVSDGFMLNLGNVLLRLCQPFCSKPNDTKILKVDPTYCAAEAKDENESRERGLHMKGMHSQTCLIPAAEGETRPVATSFNFVTECFFLTHRALDLGYRIILEKLFKISQDLARIQRLYNDSQFGGNAEVNQYISRSMETEMTKYLTFRASLLTPELLSLLAKFHAATAYWLMQVNVDVRPHELNQDNYAPNEYKPITFPLPESVPKMLRCIPEFVVENTISFLCFLRRWCPNVFEEQGPNFLNPVLTEVTALMESPTRLYNPHLRARLAEGLEALLPNNDEANSQSPQTLGTFHRQQLFVSHPHKQIIVPNLLHVFVSIEMTGQNVQFEQKFNYRRPMYIVMAYLWKIPEHRNNFKQLAQEAEANMEAVQPPLFLRFVNLLMNDAVFLLDDALSNIAQLRQMVNARESGEWDKLSQQEREQQVYYLEHIGMIARFDNILGRETIQTLKILTSEIKSIFCHPTMVDRIASMLNYLLLQLVGPNQKNLKIKDQKDLYDFNPAKLVLNICEIYINLSQNENFTLAVSQDGRSYSPELFKLADGVLVKIGGVGILGDLNEFAKKVEKVAFQKKEEEEILVDAPDDFLDPIMSTLMMDPVILPSSKTVVDRQTIARHLLSDQTDPFNRSPLTMDMVKPDVDLKKKIEAWIDQKKKERDASTGDS